MGKAFYDRFPVSKEIFHVAGHKLGFDVEALCFEGPAEELTKTEKCQPALFTTSLAAFFALRQLIPEETVPVAGAGLSLGELSALTAAGVFTLEEGFYLIQARAEAMAECAAKSPGTMLAVIGMPADGIEEVCREAQVFGANYNTPEQVVLSGTVEGIERAEALAKSKGAKRVAKLDVAGAFHSPLMGPAAEAFRKALQKVQIRPPDFPVVSNATGASLRHPHEIGELLVQQIVSPVKWEASVRHMIKEGATQFIEFPPAKVLTGMLRRIDAMAKGLTVDEPKDLEKLSEVFSVPLAV